VPEYPPTIIVVHPKEKRRKCTVQPLRGREGFVFRNYPATNLGPLDDYVLLGLDGPELSAADADRGLLILDGTWRWAASMEHDFRHVPVRSLPPWKTVYPRVSKTYDDPSQGLATIEAIYAAYTILGRQTESLLDGYYWAEEFLERNRRAV
jgi:pre-rRNA-processing protein TSR3